MNEEIKETLEYKIDYLTKSLNIGIPTKNRRYFNDINDYITNLQQDMKNYVDIVLYQRKTIDNLQQENEKLKLKYKSQKDINQKLLSMDIKHNRELEDYKSRCEKADNQLKIIMQIIKEQPTRNVEDDEWIENRLIGVVNILQNGSDEE